MMEFLRAVMNNAQNPKNVQIPFAVFLAVEKFISRIDASALANDDKQAHEYVTSELAGKKSRIVSRQAYKAIVHAQTPEEKQAAFAEYQATREFYS